MTSEELQKKCRLGIHRDSIYLDTPFIVSRQILCADDPVAIRDATNEQTALAQIELMHLVESNGFDNYALCVVHDWFVADLGQKNICDMAANKVVSGVLKLISGEFVIR